MTLTRQLVRHNLCIDNNQSKTTPLLVQPWPHHERIEIFSYYTRYAEGDGREKTDHGIHGLLSETYPLHLGTPERG
jgi:hypothetical protein